MKDYARIATKIRETPWLITESGLSLILDIMDARMSGAKLTDEEITVRLQEVGTHGEDVTNGRIDSGIGILPIYGPIFGKANMMTEMSGATSLEAFRKDFAAMLADQSIKSIILDIDSPGGTSEMVATTGDEIFAAREIKPVVAFANSTAGSAAYWLGSQAEKFYTSPDGTVGSIGAYTVHQDQSGRDAQQGNRFTYISAGPYKTEGNPHEPLSQEGASYRQEVINEIYEDFLTVVSRGRGVNVDKVKSDFGGGRMLSAKQGIIAGMVDGQMEFDALVENQIESQPQRVSFMVGDKGYAAVLTGDKLRLLEGAELDEDLAARLESVDYEHSEPGTGSPPTPRPNESDRGDTGSGSRRGDLPNKFPNEHDASGAPKAQGVDMDVEQLLELFKVDTEEALIKAITDMHTESVALRADVGLAAQEREFKTKYPAMYEQMQEDRKINRENAAEKFITTHGMFKRLEGETLVPSKLGLSALASDTLRETYLKFGENSISMADFEKCITAITQGGIVEYGEQGSSIETLTPDIDITTATGVAASRKLFAERVAEIQKSDSLDYMAAIKVAAEKYPDLAAAYGAVVNVG